MHKIVYRNMDPKEIQDRFSNDKRIYTEDEDHDQIDVLKPFISRLPQREIDLITMYYNGRKKQKEIAKFFGVTQGAISHRLSRARKRLVFLRDMPKINFDLKTALKSYFSDFEIDVIQYMVETTCQSRTAELLNKKYKLKDKDKMTQVKVRHKFDRFIDRLKMLKKSRQDVSVCYELAKYIKNNLYMMHEVVLPHFDRGYKAKYEKIC